LRVALDVTATITGSTGVARYARELSRALEERGVQTAKFAIGRAAHPASSDARHVRVPLRVMHRAWATLGWPRPELFVPGVDLVHALDLIPPPSRRPVILTVHDLTPLDHPQFHPARRTRQQAAQLAAIDRASVVLADSHAVAGALRARGIDDARIAVAHLGVTPLPPPVPVDVPSPFFLLVGEITRRKGYEVLLRAFAAAGLPSMHLVFAGPDGFDAGFCRPLVKQLGLADRALFLGSVDDAALAGLYDTALALCFPSLAEGFGLPVLEGLAQGVPVVASDIDVVREVAGDAALLVPAGDEAAWAAALVRVVEDDQLRQSLAEAGPARASTFTWARTADATIAAYERALQTATA
jgi:glycosyltransferase involved in cell wall biosynthesis